MPSGARLVAVGAGVLAGSALQLRQAALWERGEYALLVAGAIGFVLLAIAIERTCKAVDPKPSVAPVADAHRSSECVLRSVLASIGFGLACAALAFGTTGWRASHRLSQALPAALEGVELTVVGIVAGLPRRSPEAWHFRFEVESARTDTAAAALPEQLSLGWYASERAPLPALRSGQRWQLAVRLKRPHGVQNPHGFDLELLLFEQGVRATGSVRALPASGNRLLAETARHPVDRLRQAVRDAIDMRLVQAPAEGLGAREAGVLAALAVGDQAAIDRDDWALYRHTGVAHLMSISGLHVTMFAWLVGGLVAWLWRRSARLMLWCPAPLAARWGGLAAALAYAVFAGWGVPAQRTVLMLATVTLLGAAGLRWRWPLVWGAAMWVVVAIDPWALLQPGFWLSFAAIGLLMASGGARHAVRSPSRRASGEMLTTASGLAWPERSPRSGWPARIAAAAAGGLHTQLVATLGLAPLTLVFFQQLSVVGFIANLLAIPVVTLLITPLALLGALLPVLWTLAAWGVQALNAVLQALAEPAWAVWSVAAAPAWAVPAALLASALALLPLPWRVRALAVPLLLPLLMPAVTRPAAGHFDVMAIDVGQGTAVLLRTAHHTLLYDAGPQYSRESDAGERVIVPLLRALGERRLDLLVLSHRDSDHVGGAAAVLQAVSVARMSGSLEHEHPLWTLAAARGAKVGRCEAGQRWVWDGVAFEMLHPDGEALDRAAEVRRKPNTLSCVLRVSRLEDAAAGGSTPVGARSVLLAGDLERLQELALVARHGQALASDVLLVPHHGSKTSSSAALLDAVAPRVAVVQAGYRNRFGHPAGEVVARYAERGIELIDSPRCGAWRHESAASGAAALGCQRVLARRYWHHPDLAAPQNGVEVAIPDLAIDAVSAVP